jgi:hypothetical protein
MNPHPQAVFGVLEKPTTNSKRKFVVATHTVPT